MNRSVKLILSKLISKNPDENEVKELKDILNESSDEVIQSTLDEMWLNFEAGSNEYTAEKLLTKKLLDEKLKNNNLLKGKRLIFNRFRYSSVAAVLLILVSVSILVYISKSKEINPIDNIVISTKSGETKIIELPDGSNVRLNASSRISYPNNYNHSNRVLSLEGEAYFDIRKLGSKFIVKAQNHEVEVLGTTFNVKSYLSDNMLEIVLLTGKVKISRSTGQSGTVLLEPNEKYEYNYLSQQVILTQTNAGQETAWLRGELLFRNETLQQVLTNLERFYGVNISTSKLEDIQNDRFNGRFDQREIKKVLEILANHYPITFSINNKDIAISKK